MARSSLLLRAPERVWPLQYDRQCLGVGQRLVDDPAPSEIGSGLQDYDTFHFPNPNPHPVVNISWENVHNPNSKPTHNRNRNHNTDLHHCLSEPAVTLRIRSSPDLVVVPKPKLKSNLKLRSSWAIIITQVVMGNHHNSGRHGQSS